MSIITSTVVTLDLGEAGTDHEAVVTYRYSDGFRGTSLEPPEPPSVTLLSVLVGRTNILDILPDSLQDRISQECFGDYRHNAHEENGRSAALLNYMRACA